MARTSSPDPAPAHPGIALLAGKLALLAVLAGFELLVLLWIAHPSVTAQYRRRFIDHTSTCWSPPGYDHVVAQRPPPRVIVPTSLDEATSCVYFPDGWGIRDADGIWTIGRHARMRLPVTSDRRRVSLWFASTDFLPFAQEFTVRQSGSLLLAGRVGPHGRGKFDVLPSPAGVDGNGFVTLDLTIAPPARARDWRWRRNDKRLLGLALRRVEIGPSRLGSSPSAH